MVGRVRTAPVGPAGSVSVSVSVPTAKGACGGGGGGVVGTSAARAVVGTSVGRAVADGTAEVPCPTTATSTPTTASRANAAPGTARRRRTCNRRRDRGEDTSRSLPPVHMSKRPGSGLCHRRLAVEQDLSMAPMETPTAPQARPHLAGVHWAIRESPALGARRRRRRGPLCVSTGHAFRIMSALLCTAISVPRLCAAIRVPRRAGASSITPAARHHVRSAARPVATQPLKHNCAETLSSPRPACHTTEPQVTWAPRQPFPDPDHVPSRRVQVLYRSGR